MNAETIEQIRLLLSENSELLLLLAGALVASLEGGRRYRNKKRKQREVEAQICPSPQQPEQPKEQ